MRLFTIGYEQRKPDEFFRLLKENRVNVLADIRAVTHSRRREFSKTALSGKLRELGIEYIHFRDLGGPKNLRDKVRGDGDYGFFFREYGRYLDKQKKALDTLINLAGRKTVCLFCYERDVNRCHRRAVAERLGKSIGKKPEISHL